MKVLYDISVLGFGHFMPRARTGVFRVVEHTAFGLVESEECEVEFCASEGNYSHCIKYLQDSDLLAPYRETLPRNLMVRYGELVNRLPGGGTSESPIFALKRALGMLPYFAKKIVSPLANIDWSRINIYHAPFFPIPRQVREYRYIKSFQTVYDLIPLLYPQFFKFNEDHLIKKVVVALQPEDYVIAISESTKNDLCNYQKTLDPDKVFVVPLAASEKFYRCSDPNVLDVVRGKYGIPSECDYFLSVSTLEPRKNIDQVIRSFSRLLHDGKLPDLYLVLTGAKGWDYDKIFAEIANAPEIKDKIILTGYVPDEDLAPLYSGALAFVYPSFYEGFGLPPLEAMQCGAPVITSNTSSLPEVVGDAGIMVSPTDGDALAAAMRRLCSDEALRRDLSARGLERAGHFTWASCIEQTVKAYHTAMEES